MELKEFRVLARKIIDVHGFEHAAVRFDHSLTYGAWVCFQRLDTDFWTYDKGVRKKQYPQQFAEYPTVTFALEFVRQFDMSSALKIIFHELAHLLRGSNSKPIQTAHCSRFKSEMDDSHDVAWMQEMWKLGYEGKPRFDAELNKVQEKVLTAAGYEKDCNNVWCPVKKLTYNKAVNE